MNFQDLMTITDWLTDWPKNIIILTYKSKYITLMSNASQISTNMNIKSSISPEWHQSDYHTHIKSTGLETNTDYQISSKFWLSKFSKISYKLNFFLHFPYQYINTGLRFFFNNWQRSEPWLICGLIFLFHFLLKI